MPIYQTRSVLVAKCAEATSIFIRVVNEKIRESVNVKLPGAAVVSLYDLQSEIYEARFPHYNDMPVKANNFETQPSPLASSLSPSGAEIGVRIRVWQNQRKRSFLIVSQDRVNGHIDIHSFSPPFFSLDIAE